MKVTVKNGLADLLAFGRHIKQRERIFRSASDQALSEGRMNTLARVMHPTVQYLEVVHVLDECDGVRTYRLKSRIPNQVLAPFRAGQYLSLSFEQDGMLLSRPYSLSSAPADALVNDFYEVTIKRRERSDGGFFSDAAFQSWQPGSQINASDPNGFFYYEPLRDRSRLICIAGGSGITPFKAMLGAELKNHPQLSVSLFYGFNTGSDALFDPYFRKLSIEYPERFAYIPVMAQPDNEWKGEHGYISAELIRKRLADCPVDTSSVFICGPEGLHTHMENELAVFNLPRKALRRENYGANDSSNSGNSYEAKVIIASGEVSVPLNSEETILTSLERAGLRPPQLCRSGECGWCRSRLIAGEVRTRDHLTGLRAADVKFNWIHPCITFPASDIVIQVPTGKTVPEQKNL